MRRLFIACLGLGLATSPAADEPPGLTSAKAYDEQIRLEFAQPMLTWSTSSRTDVLTLSPSLDCQWIWQDDTTLACETASGKVLQPATAYRLDIGEGLWTQSGVAFPATTRTMESERPSLDLSVEWPGRQPAIEVESGQGPRAQDVAAVLALTFDGEPVAYRLEPAPRRAWEGANDVRYRVLPLAWPQAPGQLTISVREGLRSPLGPLTGTGETLAQIGLNEPFRWTGVACADTWRDDAKQTQSVRCQAASDVLLLFTQPPSDAALARIGASLPAGLALHEEPRNCGWRCSQRRAAYQAPLHAVRLRSTLAGRQVSLTLPEGLVDAADVVMPPGGTASMAFDSFPPELKLEPAVQLALPGQQAPVPVQGRNLRAGVVWRELSIGKRARYREAALPPAATPETWESADAIEPAWGVLRHGGLSLGGDTRGEAGRATARPAFNLMVHRLERELLAWATAWGDGTPKAGARIELLSVSLEGRQQVLATGRTANDGTVRLQIPADAMQTLRGPARWGRRSADRLLMLRAEHDGTVSVLPVLPETGRAMAEALDPRQPGEPTERLEKPRFGVSGRLLYRPGETVHYRLWLRERALNRLRRPDAAPVSLALGQLWEPVVTRWKETPDAWGSVTGELVLPSDLGDGLYCVDAIDEYDDSLDQEGGACFLVTRFQAQAMWARLEGPTGVRRTGESLALMAEGGFYSGGPAAGSAVELNGWLQPMPFTEAYPAYAGFRFASAWDEGLEIDLSAEGSQRGLLDAKGRATLQAQLPQTLLDPDDEDAEPLPFARLRINALVGGGDGSDRAVSPSFEAPIAAFARYVGLRSERRWLNLDEAPQLEAVVVGHDGVAVAGATVTVRLERRGNEDEAPEVFGQCTLAAGAPAACPLSPPQPGYYRLVAESGDAAATELALWFGNAPPPSDDDAPKARFELLQAARADAPARLVLHQPHARAQALFVLENDRVIRHWSQSVGASETLDVPMAADLAPGATLRVLLRPALGAAQAGLEAATLDAAVVLEVPPAPHGRVALSVADDTLEPGDTLRLTLRNEDDQARAVVVSVVDDAVHQQMAELHPRLSPGRSDFLGSLKAWEVGEWHGLQEWTFVGGWFRRDTPVGVDAGVVAPAPPADYAGDDEGTLDTIEVTGSRIKRADIAEVPVTEILPAAPNSPPGRAGPRVRRDFPDAAYWNGDITLAAGEERTLEIKLPDNLTRWRVMAWSGDEGDGFDFSETTVTASLPVELRFGLPVRLFEGDRGQGTVTARNATDAPLPITVQTALEGAGLARVDTTQGQVAPYARLAQSLALAPPEGGTLDVLSRADAGSGSDAISTRVPVQSRWAEVRLPQAGWLVSPVSLRLPPLPDGARDPSLDLQLHAGTAGWRAGWLRELREYPHRCWEQTLSRALGAALALQDAADRAAWPDAQAVVDEALASAPAFRDDDGGFHFFAPGDGWGRNTALLDAHTLRQLGHLRQLGQAVPEALLGPLRERVEDHVDDLQDKPDDHKLELLALSLAAQAGDGQSPDAAALDRAWKGWSKLSWHARSELVFALAAAPDFQEEIASGLERLAAAGKDRGLRRVVQGERLFGWAMGSDLREQCAVTTALWALDRSPERLPRRQAFLRGLQDLYAGGTASLDTQSSLHCLLALRAVDAALADEVQASTVQVAHGPEQATLTLDPAQPQADWRARAQATELEITPADGADATLNYVAQLSYQQDQAQVEARGVGLSLERRYAVLRGGRWVSLDGTAPREGEWIRVTLVVTVPALRHFVAVTDPVPGGWITRDVGLAGVAGASVQALADPGSGWFRTRQTGSTEVKLYAEALPPGRHEVHYFAQAVHAGRYFAPPAVAELMYGRTSRANTAGTWVEIR